LLIKNKAAFLSFFYFAVLAVIFGLFGERVFAEVYAFAGQTVGITGIITEKSEYSGDYAAYTVKTDLGGLKTKITFFDRDIPSDIGDEIAFTAKLSRLRDNQVFPERAYNYSKGILLKADLDSPVTVVNRGRGGITRYIKNYREYIKSEILTAFPNETGGLLCAFFLGDKSRLPDGLADNIKIAGANHFAAVSGLHLTLIVHAVMLFVGVTPIRAKRPLKFLLLFLIIVGFMIFFDLSKSVLRAGIMLIAYYGGELFYRKGSVINSLGFALVIILIVEPLACLDTGLILSVSGTIGVSLNIYRGKSKFLGVFLPAVSAAVCVLPASAVYFKGVSLLSPVASVALTPFFTVAAGALVLLLILAPIGAGGFALLNAGGTAKIMLGIINFLGRFKAAYVNLDYAFVAYWAVFAVIAVVLTRLYYKNAEKPVKIGVLSICSLVVMICSYNYFAAKKNYIEVVSDGVRGTLILRRGNSAAEIPADELNEGVYCFGGLKIAVIRANNDDAPAADLTVVYGWVRNKRVINSPRTVYVSKRMNADGAGEVNAYYDAAVFIVGVNQNSS